MCRSTGGARRPTAATWCTACRRTAARIPLLHVLTVADGSDLPETIANTEGANPHWLDDGSGFFYNQLTGAVATPERYLDSQARFHRLGTDPQSDPDPDEARSGRRGRVREDPGALRS